MDTSTLVGLISQIVSGQHGVLVVLMLVIAGLLYDRRNLNKSIEKNQVTNDKNNDRIDRILDDYFDGNRTMAQALDSLRVLLAEINGRMK